MFINSNEVEQVYEEVKNENDPKEAAHPGLTQPKTSDINTFTEEMFTKGQLISEGNLGVFKSPK